MTTIVTKNSSIASAVPTTSDLVQGELAVNVTDKRIFTENASTQIVELGTNPSTITTATATVTGTLTANGTFASNNSVVTGGTINSTPIGATTPSTVRGTTVTATTGFVGGLTGNVTGNLTGNVTGNVVGNVTGNLTGNVTASSGTTTLNDLVVNGTADFTNTKLTNITTPTLASDAANKGYVDATVAAVIDSAPAALDTLNELAAALGDDANFSSTVTTSLAGKLSLTGGTMSGAIAMGSAKITGLADPTSAQDAATKAYVDTSAAAGLLLTGGTMSGAIAMGTNKITGLGDPTLAQDAATKAYTDSILGSATSAADSAAAAATSASNASTSASNAASSATAASTSETNAALSATNAAASYDSFDDRYLGAKASDPTVDNDGDALIAGATYFNTTTDSMKVYSGSAWQDVAPVATSVTLSQVTDFPSQSGQSGKYLSTNGTVPSWETLTTDPTLGTLTKTFTNGESASISLTSSVLAPVVSVTKEVPQSGVTNNSWDVNSTTENYTRLDSAYATTLGFLSTPSVLSGYASGNTLSITSQEPTNAQGLHLSSDGLNLIITGITADAVYQYTLSTAWDLSTASYYASVSVAAKDTVPYGCSYGDSGNKLYICGASQQAHEYNLSTPYDVSTATFVQSFTPSWTGNVRNITFKPDGTAMYLTNSSDNYHYQYTLSTPWDLSTAVSVIAGTGVGAAQYGITFNDDGLTAYTSSINEVYKYTLSTAWDISTLSYTTEFKGIGSNSSKTFFSPVNNDIYVLLYDTGVVQYDSNSTLSLQLGTGSFASADVGKTIEANSGAFVLTATDGSYVETTAPTSYDQVASGSWSMYGVVYNATDGDLELSSGIISTASTLDVLGDSSAVALYQLDGNTNDTGGTYNGTWTGTAAYTTGKFSQAASFNGSSHIDTGVTYNPSNTVRTMSFWVNTSTSQVKHISVLESGTASGLYFNGFVLSYWINNGIGYSTGFTLTSGTWHNIVWVIGNGILKIYADNTLLVNTSVSVNNSTHEIVINSGITPSVCLVDQYRIFNKELSSEEISALYTEGQVFSPTGYHPVHTTASIDSTYWTDINSMTADQNAGSGNVYYAISTDDRTTWTVIDNTDGERDIVRNNAGTWQYNSNGTYASQTWVNGTTNTELATLAEAMEGAESNPDLANAVFSNSFSVSSQDSTPAGVCFNTTGTKMFVVGGTSPDSVYEYTLSIAFNVATSSFVDSFDVSSQDIRAKAIAFNANGTKMFVVGSTNDSVFEYNLSASFDVSSASYSQSFSVASQETDPQGLAFNTNGTKMFVVGSINDSVFEYNLSSGFDISSASYSQGFSVSAKEGSTTGVAFNTDGTQMFVVGNSSDAVHQYNLSTGFDVSSAVFSKSFSVSSQDIDPQDITFSADGSKMFIVGETNASVYQYALTSYTNQMDKTQLDAVTDPNHIALGNDLDLAIVFNMTSGSTVPSSDGVAINYDANVLNKGAVLGTDYDFDAPTQNSVRITALAANNLKVRVV